MSLRRKIRRLARRRRSRSRARASCRATASANSSSALITAVAEASRPATISPSARATPSMLPKPSRCSAPALVMRPTVGRASFTSVGHFAGMIGADLDHRVAVRGVEPVQRERHADVIVEIAARRERRARALEDGRGHFLDRGLAVAAGDADDGHRKLRAPGGGGAASEPPGCRARPPAPAAARRGESTTAPAAPAVSAAATKSLALKRGPRSATNSSPALSVRVSVDTPV